VDREEALQLLARLHSAQNSFYSGGGEGELRALLALDIVCHVPGRNLIAGAYRGHARPNGHADMPARTHRWRDQAVRGTLRHQ
jgi:hypothetical protein